jgi:EAL domain-containing protein (putative c-di-GMP-specific phosphodiesterase class I)/DNA-binding NarL/FixJ family response regulator
LSARERKSTPVGGEKLLVVDDNSANRELLTQFLKAKGYDVTLAATGEQALELVDRTALDLVLLDLSLPRANSLEVLKQLRQDHSPADLPVIMVSGESDTSQVVEALTLGANDYISKPIELGLAMGRIRTQLARKKLEDKLRADAVSPGTPSNQGASPLAGVAPRQEDSHSSAATKLLSDARTTAERADSLVSVHTLTFKPQMRDLVASKLELEQDLRNALANKEFELYYQPKVQLETGTLMGFEALLRWHHPRRNLVPPLEFIPLAESTGLIVAIGDWVLEEACRQTCDWHARYPAHSRLTVGVNVSSKQLEDPGLAARISKILADTGLAPECLALEITESALVSDGPEVLKVLKELRNRNIGLHIDDFGTGYSALQYLQRLPFDTLKIDKSFVDRLGATRETTEITRAIIALAHHLHMNVVSEGIETIEQLNILRDFGARVGQGYLFSRPLSREQAEELLTHGFEYDMEALLAQD